MTKKISIIIIFLMMLFLVSCNMEDTTNQALEEFSKYQETNDTALVTNESIITFSTHTLDLTDLIGEGYILNGGYIIKKDKIYFSATLEEYMFSFNLYIYECDIYGKNLTKIFNRSELKTNPKVTANNMVFYYEHYTDNASIEDSRVIDAYDILGQEHKRVASGKSCTISDYREKNTSDYVGKLMDKPYIPLFKDESYYEITNKKTNETKIINQEFIENTKYNESLLKFDYSTKRIDISYGHILITLSIKAGNGVNHPYLIFEYDFQKDTLEFKQISFLDVDVLIDIIYLE